VNRQAAAVGSPRKCRSVGRVRTRSRSARTRWTRWPPPA
jgi:hypothetical protein